MKRYLYGILIGLLVPAVAALAAEEQKPAPAKKQEQVKKKEEVIYGRQMMTREEINEYRTKMRAAKTVEEREQIRKEHHEKMKARAKERGVTLPDEPPMRGPGMGPGGGGMGPGKGMGPGGGGMGPRY
ncbi:MAG: hypothetical protein EPN55_00230 [Gammaproteobacteria bacterium]|nr:MAG: hypothetical protein EPN55_00230 [Gammaproteobacteria bacterium]